jgi:hypothetical protein
MPPLRQFEVRSAELFRPAEHRFSCDFASPSGNRLKVKDSALTSNGKLRGFVIVKSVGNEGDSDGHAEVQASKGLNSISLDSANRFRLRDLSTRRVTELPPFPMLTLMLIVNSVLGENFWYPDDPVSTSGQWPSPADDHYRSRIVSDPARPMDFGNRCKFVGRLAEQYPIMRMVLCEP